MKLKNFALVYQTSQIKENKNDQRKQDSQALALHHSECKYSDWGSNAPGPLRKMKS